MKNRCLEIGTIQAFLDGETGPEVSLQISAHIADCDNCARQLAEAEEENTAVFAALDREFNALVPTQRLWHRINDSLELERDRTPIWKRVFSLVSLQVMNPSFTAAAGLLVLAGLASAVWFTGWADDTPTASNGGRAEQPSATLSGAGSQTVLAGTGDPGSAANDSATVNPPPVSNLTAAAPMKAGYSPNRRSVPPSSTANQIQPMTLNYIPGEESYLKTITALNASVDSQKDRVLPPSSRVAFERDLAVVDSSIRKMQQIVRRNPRDQAARQVLYAAYQDKIDLLNSVGQREELMASLH